MSSSSWVIENARVVDPSQGLDRVARVLIHDRKIAAIDPSDDDLPTEAQRVDGRDQILAPGLVDLETELGEPGCEEDETIASGTSAAVAGGYTTVVCTANTDPAVDTASTVEFIKQKSARSGKCRVYPIGCVSKNRQGEELAEIGSLVDAGAVALGDIPRPLSNTALMRRALEYCSMFDRTIIDRPEVTSLTRGGLMHEGFAQLMLAMPPIPSEAEDLATSRNLRLLETTGGKLHLSSISTSGSVALVRRSKKRGTPVTVGIRLANLCFDDELMKTFDSSLILNPPLRSRDHIDKCINAVADGTIDLITSGHQPKALEKKMQELSAVPFGMTSIELTLSKLISELIETDRLSWSRLIECLSTNPARVLGLASGTLGVGSAADAVLIDPKAVWTVEADQLYSRNRNTPLLGKQLVGKAVKTWVNGELAYDGRVL